MIVSSMLRKDESLEEEARGSTAAIGSTTSSAVASPDGGLGAAPVEDSTLRHLELVFN